MKFYVYDPDAAGSYGENTVFASGEKPRKPVRLHYEFHLWPEEDLQCWISCYVGTERLRKALEALNPPISGVDFDEVEISGDDEEFRRVERKGRSDAALGKWYWFKVIGRAGQDDFGESEPARDLVISERVRELLIEKNMVIHPPSSFCDWPVETKEGSVSPKG